MVVELPEELLRDPVEYMEKNRVPLIKPILLLIALIGSAFFIGGTYFTEGRLSFFFSILVAVCGIGMLTIMFFGKPRPEPEQPKPQDSTYEQLQYQKRMAQLKAERDFFEQESKPRRESPQRLFYDRY